MIKKIVNNKIAQKISENEKVQKHKNLIIYIIIGGIAAIIDMGSFAIFLNLLKTNKMLVELKIDGVVANFISMNLGMIFSFLGNTYINFKKTDNIGKRATKFFVIGYTGVALSTLFNGILGNLFPSYKIVIKAISIILVAAYQFGLNKKITYKDHDKKK